MDTLPDKNNHDSNGQKDTGSNKPRIQSVDSGVYVTMDEYLHSTELEKTNDVKENHQNESLKINPQPEVQNSDGAVLGLKGSTSSVILKVDKSKALSPPAVLSPPPLPPKKNRKQPGFKKSSSQGTELKVSNEENKPINSLICQMSPAPGGDKDDHLCSGLITGKIPEVHNSCIFGILPKGATKCFPQPSAKPAHKPPRKPPRLNKLKRAEVEEQQQRRKPEVGRTEQEDKKGGERSRHEQYLTEREDKTKENTEASARQVHLGLAKPSRQILVIFTDMDKDKGEDEDPSNTATNTLNQMEQSSMLPHDEKPATNSTCKSENSPKPDLKIPAKPPIKCCPVPPIKPLQLLSTMKAAIEEDKERRKQEEEQRRYEDTLDKGREEYEGEANEVFRDTKLSSTALTEMSQQVEELTRGGQRFNLTLHYRNSPKPVNTAGNQTIQLRSQLLETQRPNKANGQFNAFSLLQDVSLWISPSETDSNMETLKCTENKNIHISEQVIAKMYSGCPQDAEVFSTELDPCQLVLKRLENTQDIGDTILDGDLKQTNQKPSARMKVKTLAKKVMCKIKEGRDRKRRIKAGELGMNDEPRQDAWKEDEEETGRDEEGVGVTETLAEIKRRYETSASPFGSFKVYGPVKLVAELLSGDEWSQFLHTEQTPSGDSLAGRTQAEDRAQNSVNVQFSFSTEPDVSEGDTTDPEGEPLYEKIELSNVKAEEQQNMNGSLGPAAPQILVKSGTNLMSPRIKAIYDTVEFIQPPQPANAYFNLPEIKSLTVLDSSVQKYLIMLRKKRKHKVRKKRWKRSQGTLSDSLSPSSSQLFTTSIFYKVPTAAAGIEKEQQASTAKCGRPSP
ncbi:uncharacterized protein si:dkey-9i23.6 isoform X2 [Channa argus]|uniref:uncharacterized protein si:dkey-9i23.6 isoform X2 n=1 Tax=Channa argus TaxID=215402 RepID=UPI003522848B